MSPTSYKCIKSSFRVKMHLCSHTIFDKLAYLRTDRNMQPDILPELACFKVHCKSDLVLGRVPPAQLGKENDYFRSVAVLKPLRYEHWRLY